MCRRRRFHCGRGLYSSVMPHRLLLSALWGLAGLGTSSLCWAQSTEPALPAVPVEVVPPPSVETGAQPAATTPPALGPQPKPLIPVTVLGDEPPMGLYPPAPSTRCQIENHCGTYPSYEADISQTLDIEIAVQTETSQGGFCLPPPRPQNLPSPKPRQRIPSSTSEKSQETRTAPQAVHVYGS